MAKAEALKTEPLPLAVVRVSTFLDQNLLTRASGFFFQNGKRLFLVSSRHVMFDEPGGHYPNRLEIELHIDPENMTQSLEFSIPLYREGKGLWRQAEDSGGPIDVAVIEIDRTALPKSLAFSTFTPAHLPGAAERIELGTSLLIVGFPLGFHDTLHHMPVARRAAVASSYGLRFQGQGYFLTDARTHRGTSGAPVVMRAPRAAGKRSALPWLLLGVHSARLDVGSRDLELDEALGLNSAWYADILLTLTDH